MEFGDITVVVAGSCGVRWWPKTKFRIERSGTALSGSAIKPEPDLKFRGGVPSAAGRVSLMTLVAVNGRSIYPNLKSGLK